MKKFDKKKSLIAGGALVGVIFIYFISQHYLYVTTDNAQVETHSLLLASKVGGFIADVKVTEGQRVAKGDLLVRIDERDYQNTLNQVQNELRSLQARKNDAEKSFSRISSLYSTGAVSNQQYDTAHASVSEVKAKYEALAAQVAQAELNFQNTKIIAPMDGFIAKKSVEVGQLTGPGVPLIGFVGAEERWVIANFKETEIDGIHVGNEAHISVDAISHKTFKGKVVSLSAATGATFSLLPPDNATGNFTKVVQRVPVKIAIEGITAEDIAELRAGLSADVKVRRK